MVVVLITIISCATVEEDSTDLDQRWYKGNLHTHSYWSDGDDYPEMIMDWYKSNGYNFVGLSDHNILQEGEKWKLLPKSPMHLSAFEAYKTKFGEDWVEWKEDTGRISVRLKGLAEYRSRFDEGGSFLIIKSEEITDQFEGKPIHLNATGIEELILPKGGNSVTETMQNNINSVLEQRQELQKPMFPHINHPNFGLAITAEDMIQLEGERFFEVYNGHPAVLNEGDSLHLDTETMWDKINIAYFNDGKPLMYGLATDDSHNYHTFGLEYSNTGRGWVMVEADELTSSSLIEAMEEGKFYASTGVTLAGYSFNDGKISINVRGEPGVSYEIRFIGFDGGTDSRVLKEMEGEKAEFDFSEDVKWVRVKVISNKKKSNPYSEGEFEVAWTQPELNTRQ
jgi:hypothetical protein